MLQDAIKEQKYMKKLVFLLLFIFCSVAHAQTHYVNTKALNLRSCGNIECKSIAILQEGEIVDVVEDRGLWVKVQTERGNGYVAKSFLIPKTYSIADKIIGIFFLGIGIWLIIFLYFLPSRIAANNKNAHKIYKVNVILGWFPIIWLLLLFAAIIGENTES